MMPNRVGTISWGSLAVITVLSAALFAAVQHGEESPDGPSSELPTKSRSDSAVIYETVIQSPSGPPGIPTGEVDRLGNPVLANCTTCHATREANTATRVGDDLKEFHQGLVMKHGDLQCVACHGAGDYSELHLASGESIPFSESMRLCAQCHGPQYRDYRNGAHGGMMGHWDLTKGPRQRNHCLTCHDAHAPPYRPVMPVFRPQDLKHAEPPTGSH